MRILLYAQVITIIYYSGKCGNKLITLMTTVKSAATSHKDHTKITYAHTRLFYQDLDCRTLKQMMS